VNPNNKYWWFAAASFLIAFALAGVLAFFLWQQIPHTEAQLILNVIKDQFIYIFAFLFIFLAGFGFFLDAIFNNYVIPINRLTKEIASMNSENPSFRIKGEGSKEIGRLLEAINKGADRLDELRTDLEQKIQMAKADLEEEKKLKQELEKAQTQLLQAEKMASLGKMAAGVAHQLNNPLGGITLFTQLVLEDYDLPEKAKEDLQRILKDAQRCRDTVRELLEFARQTRKMMQPHDLNKAITRTLFLLENQTLFHNIRIEKKLAPSLPPVYADIQQLNHLLMNIILNAAEAMEGQGNLSIQTELCNDQRRLLLAISDSGPGIPEDVRQHIFEPFFTTKDPGKGTGLGLSMVYGIVQNHGGKIHTLTPPGKGTTFIIELQTAESKDGDLSDHNEKIA
jgi:signal transduction histidine kinase